MKTLPTLMLSGLLAVSLVGCGNQQQAKAPESAPDEGTTAKSAQSTAQDLMAKTKTEAQKVQKNITQAAEDISDKSQEAMTTAKDATQEAADAAKQKVEQLLAEAKKLLNEGKFEESIATAKNVINNFNIDSATQEAQKIIETAKAKIQEAAGQQVESIKTGISDTMNKMGQ